MKDSDLKNNGIRSGFTVWVYAIAFLIVVIWGCTFVQTKVLINSGLRPDEIFTLRFVIAYLLMLPFAGRRLFLDNFKDEMTALLLGLFGGSLYFIVENYALAYGYCSNVSLIVCLTPLVTALIVGWRYPAERLGKAGMVGSLVALTGMALVVFNGNFVLKLSPLGDLLSLAACLCWALYSLLIKRLGTRYSNMLVTRKVFGYGLLTILPLVLVRGINYDIVIGGGGELFAQTLPITDRIYLTVVHRSFDGETVYPEMPEGQFVEISRKEIEASIPYAFIEYHRK